MFENDVKNNKTNQVPAGGKEINLLPEDLRHLKKKASVKSSTDSISYTKPGKVLPGQTVPDNTESIMSKLKGFLGKSRKSLAQPISNDKKEDVVSSPAKPLSKLYSQTSVNQPAPKSKSKTESTPEPAPEPAPKPKSKTEPTPKPKTDPKPEKKIEEIKPPPPIPKSPIPLKNELKITSEEIDKDKSKFSWRSKSTDTNSILAKIDSQLGKKKDKEKAEESNKDQFDVNLIPEEMVYDVDVKKIAKAIILSTVLGILFTAAVYLGVDLYRLRQQKNVQGVQSKIDNIKEIIDGKYDDLEVLRNYQKTYDNVQALLDHHVYWTSFFDFLEDTVLEQDVYYEDVEADINGLITIHAKAKTFSAVAQQYRVLEAAPEVTFIEINGANIDAEQQQQALEEAFRSLLTPESPKVVINEDGEEVIAETAIEEIDKDAVMQSLSFAEQNELVLKTLQNAPISFSINLIINSNQLNKNEKGETRVLKVETDKDVKEENIN